MNRVHITTIKESDTLVHQPTVWPVPYACAQPYNPGNASHGQLYGCGCHCLGDMAVRMRKVLTRPWVGVPVCHLLLLSLCI